MRLSGLVDQAPAVIFVGISLVLVGAVVTAYVQSSRARSEPRRRRASWIAAVVSGAVAFFGTVAYAIPALGDLHNPRVPLLSSLLGLFIVWTVCLLAWIIAARCVFSALKKSPIP